MSLVRDWFGKIVAGLIIVVLVSVAANGGINAQGAQAGVDNGMTYGAFVGIVLKGFVEGAKAVTDGWNMVPSQDGPAPVQ